MTIQNTTATIKTLNELPPLMREMRLTVMADTLEAMLNDPNSQLLSKEEWISKPFMSEYSSRCSKKTMKYVRKAHLKIPGADLNDLDTQCGRTMDMDTWYRLTQMNWIKEQLNLVITGPAGSGKTWCACALAIAACERYMDVAFWSVNQLIMKLKTYTPAEYLAEIKKISDLDLLILDDVGLMAYDLDSCRIFFELLDCRYQRGSTILTAALPVSSWYELFTDHTYADATLSRAVGNAVRLEIEGPDLRIKSSKPRP